MRILILEDDQQLALYLRQVLEEDGYEIEVSRRGDTAVDLVMHGTFDMVLVDLGLPGRDGLDIVTDLRRSGVQLPLLIVSGRTHEDDIVTGLNAGADDYVVKPVSPPVLRARVRAAARRRPLPTPAESSFGDIVLRETTREVCGPLGRVELTGKEFAILGLLLSRPGQSFTRARMLEQVWGYTFDPGTNVLEVGLTRVRQKLRSVSHVTQLRTVRGVGVMIHAGGGEPTAD